MIRWFARMGRAAHYEVRGAFRRPWEIITGILMPLLWVWVLSQGFGGGLMTQLPVGLVDLDGGPSARAMIQTFDALPSVSFVGYTDRQSAQEGLRRGDTYAVLVIPRNFTKDEVSGTGGTAELELNKSLFAIGTTLEVDFKTALGQIKLDNGATLKTRYIGGNPDENEERLRANVPNLRVLGNPAFNFNGYLLITLIPGVLGIACALTLVGVLVRDWRDGSMRGWLKSAEGSVSAALVGKLLPWTALYSLFAIGWVAWFAGFEGNVPAGSLWLWMVGAVLFIWGTIGYGLLFSAMAPSWVIALVFSIAFFAPSFPFTGFSYPFNSMTPGVPYFGSFLPLTTFLEVQGACWSLGTDVSHTLKLLGHLALFTVIPGGIGTLILMKKIPMWAREERLVHATRAPKAPLPFEGEKL